jgi:PAS domain S-box-containing protein
VRPPAPSVTIDGISRALDRLVEQVDGAEALDPDAMLEVLAESRTTLEELRAAEEQLVEQNDALATAHVMLASERKRYEELFQLAPDAYVVTDLDGVVLDANGAAAQLFATAPRFLTRKPLAAFVDPALRQEFRTRLGSLRESDTPVAIDLRFRRRDGVMIDVAATVAPYRRDHTSIPIGLRWALRDVSEQKQAEERLWELNAELERRVEERTRELERQSALLESVLDQLPLGVVIASAPSASVTFVNRYARELRPDLGSMVSIEQYLPDRLEKVDGTPYRQDELPLQRAVRGEQVSDETIELTGAEGRRIVKTSAVPVRDASSAIVAAAAVFEDVSELERRQRAEREFVANAAHELRTPLAAITSAIEVLQAGAKERPAERDLFLGHIERESARLGGLARALLLLARIQSGVERAGVEIVPLRPLFEDVAASIRPAPGVRLSIRCPRNLAAVTNGELVEQALRNLLTNATRYTKEGTITLRAARSGRRVVVKVCDTGVGLTREARERMFDRFYRAGTRDADGFGLGLSITAQAVEAVGGTLAVDSVEGRGTTFSIELPVAQLVAS